MLFGLVFRVIAKHNLSQAIMPPHIRGVLDCLVCLPRVSALTRLHAEATLCRPLTWALNQARQRLAG